MKDPIAIIGLGCRFPKADGPAAFWKLLKNGEDAITQVPGNRWNRENLYDPSPATPGKMNTRWGGFLDNLDGFEPEFFSISPREAHDMDPQQRLVLEVAWEALEQAGILPAYLAGTSTGVFIGISNKDYRIFGEYNQNKGMGPYSAVGQAHCIAANRLSYLLDLRGPSLAVDTACSSSLVSVHLACQSLQSGESELAIAGGVNVILLPGDSIALSQAQMMAPDGRCKTFDARANGYVRGEGCGLVILKRLADALRDSDPILAVIRGSAVNQDGLTNGLTAPKGKAQQDVIGAALSAAGVAPAEIGYVETHGTGTSLGDPIEVGALKTVLMTGRASQQQCYLGAVKTNIGHLETAAGIAGLIKVVLSLKHQQIPPNLHLQQLNPRIQLEDTPLEIITQLQNWPQGYQRRVAGVSSFSFGGTNAHVVVEAASEMAVNRSQGAVSQHLFTLSAQSELALHDLVERYIQFLSNVPAGSLGDICFTQNTGRTHWSHRLVCVIDSIPQLQQSLKEYSIGEESNGCFRGNVQVWQTPKIAVLFTGQGSQYVDMGRQLYETQPIFKATLDTCAQILDAYLDKPLLEVLYPQYPQYPQHPQYEGAQTDGRYTDNGQLDQTMYTQPALFALEYALCQLWQSWGMQPTVVMGHSVGEYVAACVAGVFSLEDGLRLIAHRGRLMQQLPPNGGMVSLLASVEQVKSAIATILGDRRVSEGEVCAIAGINGPQSTVISGTKTVVQSIVVYLKEQGIKSKPLQVSHAFHSPLMQPMLAEFEQVARQISYAPPQLKFISNLTGELATNEVATAEYWCQHISSPVNFLASMETLQQQGCSVILECGAKPILLGMGQQCLPDNEHRRWVPSLRPGYADWQQMLSSLGELYVSGVKINWSEVYQQATQQRKISLPTYPFQRQRYWLDIQADNLNAYSQIAKFHPLLGQRLALAARIKEIVFEVSLDAETPHYLKDHVVFDTVVFPGAGYLEMALAAGATVFGSDAIGLEEVAIHQPLILSSDKATTLQMVLSPVNTYSYEFEISSLDTTNPSQREITKQDSIWCIHASGRISQEALVELENIASSHEGNLLELERFYQALQDKGINFGPCFQSLKQIWIQSDKVGSTQIQLPSELGSSGDYFIHPILLDGAFQLAGAVLMTEYAESMEQLPYLPVGVKRLQVYRRAGNQLQAQVHFNQLGEIPSADIELVDQDGGAIARIEGLSLRRAPRQTLLHSGQPTVQNGLYRLHWQLTPRSPEDKTLTSSSGCWLIFAPHTDLAPHLIDYFKQQDVTCVVVYAGHHYRQIAPHHYEINPLERNDFSKVLHACQMPLQGLVHCWSLESASNHTLDATSLAHAQTLGCASVLHLIQALEQSPLSEIPPLWLLTKGAQSITSEAEAIHVTQSPLWGMARVIALEYPDYFCGRIDLDPASLPNEDLAVLKTELFATNRNEEQIAYRQGQRYLARLRRHRDPTLSQLPWLNQSPVQLRLSEYGLLENLTLQPLQRRSPAAHEVEVNVQAVGLNFRDVLNVLGLLKEYYAEQLDVHTADQITFGFECTGKVVRVGEMVTHVVPGDAVMLVLVPDAFSSYVTTRADWVVKQPANLTSTAAATIPLAFLTAYYGLHQLANVQPGDRVLIHAAAGGVGQAAVQIAQQVGAEVFATASPPKWEFLQSMGVTRIMNSRTLDFADQVMAWTQGQGVDVVLNSLTGDALTKSLEVLSPGGRFIEIGKIGIRTHGQMQQQRPDVTYYPFDLGEVGEESPVLIQTMLNKIVQHLEQGNLKPLRHQVYDLDRGLEAFRLMQQGKHMGKLVIRWPEPINLDAGLEIKADASYLITGGLGSLGLQVAEWLVEKGCGSLVLSGRRGASNQAQNAIADLTAMGAKIQVIPADITQEQDILTLLEKIDQTSPPLRGIIHAAGMLADGMLHQQKWEDFCRVMAPKVQGTWQLHSLTQERDLDFFVCFSSAAALLGSESQGNYAAANAFMDGLSHYRRSQGKKGLSVNWGPWSGEGMTQNLSLQLKDRMAQLGFGLMAPKEGLQMLEKLLVEDVTQAGVIDVHWPTVLQRMPGQQMSVLEYFQDLRPTVSAGPPELLQQLQASPPAQRKDMLIVYLQTQIAKTLGFPSPNHIQVGQRLFDLGVDSLMAVELKNRLQSSLGKNLRSTLLFNYPTVEALANYLEQLLSTSELDGIDSNALNDLGDASQSQASPDELGDLSEEEILALLAEELTQE